VFNSIHRQHSLDTQRSPVERRFHEFMKEVKQLEQPKKKPGKTPEDGK
jgi:hypothetical protein